VSLDDFDELANRIEKDFPPSWIPSDEEPVRVGAFQRLDKGTNKFGTAWIAVLKGKDGKEFSLWLLHTVLINEFKRQAPKPGELVAVKYLGKKTGDAGQGYVGFRVEVKRDKAGPNWDDVQGDSPDEGPTAQDWADMADEGDEEFAV